MFYMVPVVFKVDHKNSDTLWRAALQYLTTHTHPYCLTAYIEMYMSNIFSKSSLYVHFHSNILHYGYGA